MLKRYKSKSCISLSVKLPTGGTTHVSFTPQTGGGSVLYTENEKLQEGLEKHPKYGRLFDEDKIEEQERNQPINTVSGGGGNNESNGGTTTEGEDGSTLRVVKVLCNDDAKEHLATKFGISRSKLRSRVQIEASAKANGIRFVWERTANKSGEEPEEDEAGEDDETDDDNPEPLNEDEV